MICTWICLASVNVFWGQVHERQNLNSKISQIQRLGAAELLKRPVVNSSISYLKLIVVLSGVPLLFFAFPQQALGSWEQLVINHGSQKLACVQASLATLSCPTELHAIFSLSHLISDSEKRIEQYQIIPTSYLNRVSKRIVLCEIFEPVFQNNYPKSWA